MSIGDKIEIYSLDELYEPPCGLKFFSCIGGSKNYQSFLDIKSMSRAEFMSKYINDIDKCHIPLFEDNDIIIRQDAQIAIPGFYIVATKFPYRKISEMSVSTYQKCLEYTMLIKLNLKEYFDIQDVYIYYEEHYLKASSTHFWVLPIYQDVILENNLTPTILKKDIWTYQNLFEFQYMKDKIYDTNDKMQRLLERRKQ